MKSFSRVQILQILLFTGALYFFSVALVHSLGFKIPGLFVYYNVPSYAYQDRIISFLAFGWSTLFYLAAKKLDPDLINLILIIGLAAIVALTINTLVTDFSQMDQVIHRRPFFAITAILFVYWVSLVVFGKNPSGKG